MDYNGDKEHTMKLYIKQKVFSWGDKFMVKDESEQDKYSVQGEVFSLGKKLHIKDLNGNEVAFIHQKVFSLMPRYFVYKNDQQVAEIVQKFKLFKPAYVVNGPGWKVEGNFSAHLYRVFEADNPIINIEKIWFSWGDSYVLDIDDSTDEVLALAVVLAIDAATQQANTSNNNNH